MKIKNNNQTVIGCGQIFLNAFLIFPKHGNEPHYYHHYIMMKINDCCSTRMYNNNLLQYIFSCLYQLSVNSTNLLIISLNHILYASKVWSPKSLKSFLNESEKMFFVFLHLFFKQIKRTKLQVTLDNNLKLTC